jgi:uncharacterized protein YjdB
MTFTFKLSKRIAHSRRSIPRLAAALIFLAGCADSVGTEPTDQSVPDTAIAYNATNITVTPGSASGSVGQSAQFSAVIRDKNGSAISGHNVTWSASNSAVVRVTASGYATAVGGGTTTVNASYNGIVGRATVTVTGTMITVSKVALTPKTRDLVVGGKQQFSASVTDASGASLPTVGIQWVTTSSSIVKIDSTGLATALTLGSVKIIARAGGKADTASVNVGTTPPPSPVASVTITPGSAAGNVGDAAQFSATVKDSAGNVLTGQAVTWSSSNTAVVTVNSTGYATGVGGGTANLVATVGGKSGLAAITVAGGSTPPSSAPVASVSLSSTNLTLPVGGLQTIGVTLKDSVGNVLTGRAVTWTSSNLLVATTSNLGLVTGLLGGTATVTATSEGKSASATVTVSASAPPPPPPSGVWAHEPSSYSQISDNGFDLLTALGWGMVWNTAGNGSIVSDNTAPLSGSNVLEMRYPVGFAGGSGPANEWLPLGNLHRMYAGFYWKASNPWQGHSSNVNKILFVFPSSGGDIYIAMYGPPGGPYELRVLPQFPGLASEWLRPNVNNTPVTVGNWHKIEWIMDYGSGGADGTIQWWMDGQMIGDYRNVQFPSGGLTEFKINPTWGGVGDNKTENDYFRYDHIHLSGN